MHTRHLAAQTHVWCCNPIELDWHFRRSQKRKYYAERSQPGQTSFWKFHKNFILFLFVRSYICCFTFLVLLAIAAIVLCTDSSHLAVAVCWTLSDLVKHPHCVSLSIAMYIFIQHFKVIPLCFLYIFHLLVFDRMQDHENKTNRKKQTWTKGILIYHINTYIRYTYNCIIEVSYVVSESWEYLNERVFIEN